ncbi:hypothetical protein LCL89_06795 [Halobacillus yeomjeoni]|uniref:S-Ena type endospore appendage n=1 Tax=Halobacillus yeomjeoni TaxID=311194 RepID=UPI001CD6408A|nr:S-Ena type endospore appendage [Halobacillus yeomjeoni]MCA0983764.1 hypothetical protein [Halobacillus yeomjeoni]
MGNCCCCPDRGGAGDFLTDEICGNFTIACGNEVGEVVWTSNPTDAMGAPIGPAQPVIGTVSVYFDRGCGDTVTVQIIDDSGDTDVVVSTFKVPDAPQSSTGNTRAQTITKPFTKVVIFCDDDLVEPNEFCTGKFCITAHYNVR